MPQKPNSEKDKMARYYRTNENPKAIIAGLGVQEGDNILSIGGSGDNPFAMLTKGARVTAIDKSKWQIKYMNEQTSLIEKRDYTGFMHNRARKKGFPGNQYNYPWEDWEDIFGTKFFTEEIFNIIGENIDLLQIKHSSLLEAIKNNGFNKIYLSNAIGHGSTLPTFRPSRFGNSVRQDMKEISCQLPEGGLIYAASGKTIWDKIEGESNLVIDNQLSSKAIDTGWNPLVFRKV